MKDLEEIAAEDIPEFSSLLKDLNTNMNDVTSHLKKLHETLSDQEIDYNNGISFIEMKCNLFLQYLINLAYVILLKLDGETLVKQTCIERLVEIRTVVEKIRPIDKKLNYQIDKLIKMANEKNIDKSEQHPLSYKPNLENLLNKEDEDESDSGKEETNEKGGVYLPPKLTAVPYDEGDKGKLERKLEKAKKKALNSALLDDLRNEYSEAPLEIRDDRNSSKQRKFREKEEERVRFEEDNLRRLTVTKKDRLMKRKMNELDEVVKLGSFRSFNEESSDEDERYKPNLKKKKKGKSSKGKFKKRMQRKR